MVSFRSVLLRWVMRIFVKRMVKPDMDIPKSRQLFSKLDRFIPALPNNIKLQTQTHPEFTLSYLENSNKQSKLVIFYIHGGGFMLEMKTIYTSFVARLCDKLNADAYMPWYRLAPEHPFPAAPDDCFSAYQALLDKGIKAKDIVIVGDSAGGNLTLSTLLQLRDTNMDMPCGAVLLSPVTDLAQTSSSWMLNGWTGQDPLFPKDAFDMLEHYCTDNNRTNTIMSPYYGDYHNFPPMLFIASQHEALLEDSLAVAKKARAANVLVRADVWRKMIHVFPLIGFLPESKKAIQDVQEFITDCHQQAVGPGFDQQSPLFVIH